MVLSLVSTQQVPPISHSTHSAKLFFQKVTAVVVIYIDLQRNIMRSRGACAWDIRANTPSPLLPRSGVQKKGGGKVFGTLLEYGFYIIVKQYRMVCLDRPPQWSRLSYIVKPLIMYCAWCCTYQNCLCNNCICVHCKIHSTPCMLIRFLQCVGTLHVCGWAWSTICIRDVITHTWLNLQGLLTTLFLHTVNNQKPEADVSWEKG